MENVTPRNLLASITAIFPAFEEEWNFHVEPDEPVSFHSVFSAFLQFFGTAAKSASDRQLAAIAAIINQAAEAEPVLENAVDTCFLEHLQQIKATGYLRPHLNRTAREKLRGG